MSIARGDYIMWFAQYGSITHQRMTCSLEKVVDYVARMDQESTADYDDHGIPLDLEHVGEGIVENFHDLVRARDDELRAEREAGAAEYRKQQAEKKATGPTYSIFLTPPPQMDSSHSHLYSYRAGTRLAFGLPFDDLVAERERLEGIFGRDRITVREHADA